MLTQEKIKEILKDHCINLRFHARGGQGGVTASNLCVEAYLGYGVCQPKFGAERMGSPTESYVRLSANEDLVRSNEQVYAPSFVSVLDPSLLGEVDVTAGVPEGGWLIVNTTLDQAQIQDIVGRKDINVATIDATFIAMEVLGRNITNTIILGALIRISHLFTLDELSDAIMRRFKGELAGKNVEAIKRAIEETCIYESGVEPDFTVDSKVPWQQVSLGLPGYTELDKAGVWYCDEEEAIKVGSYPVNTGSWGEYDIIWDGDTCTDCAQCWYICPDFAIIREKGEDDLYHMTGIDLLHCKACCNCINVCPVKAISKKLKQGPGSCAVPEEEGEIKMSVEPMKMFFKEIKEPVETAMIGNYAVAGGVTQTDPDVICAFPITPQTQSVEGLSDVVNQGRLKAAFVNVESELAAISYSTAACAAGARTFTATASQGYLLMCEGLPMPVGWRVPLTMLISARAFNAPNLSIWNSWEFVQIGSVGFGWNCIVSENVQETYDASILSVMIAEDSLFPTMFVHDGFIISHSVQKLTLIPDETVLKLTPKKPRHHINPQKPGTWGGIVTPGYFMEGRMALEAAKRPVLGQMTDVFKRFKQATGREYNLIETYNLDNSSKTAYLTMGSMCGNIISWMTKNKDVGLIKIRGYRPFPTEQLQKIVQEHNIEKLIILEKSDALDNLAPFFTSSITTALYPLGTIFRSYIVGLGGRDVTRDELDFTKKQMQSVTDMKGPLYSYLGVRETKNKIMGVDL